jgi:hypothetical protein
MIRFLEDQWRATPALDDESSKIMFPEFKALQTKSTAGCAVRFHSCDTLVPPAHISIASLRAWSTG